MLSALTRTVVGSSPKYLAAGCKYVSTRRRWCNKRIPCRDCELGSILQTALTHPWLAWPWRIRLQFRVQPMEHVIILLVHRSSFPRSRADYV